MSSSIESGTNATPDRIEAPMNYLVDTGEKPVNYMYAPPPGVPFRTGEIVKQNMAIINGRPVVDEITLDNQGFMLTEHHTAVRDFYDEAEVRRVYYPRSSAW